MTGPFEPPTIAAVETAVVSLEASPDLAVHGARGSHASSTFTLVRVSSADGLAGYGEISATPRWSGEDDVISTHLTRDVIAPVLIGEELRSVPALTAKIDRALAGNPFTKAGVNMALWDLLGRRTGLRVVELLGGPFRDSVPVKMSLSGDGEQLAACYEAISSRGFEAFKVKVGIDLETDISRFEWARELVGEGVFLGADANGGWTRIDAAAAVPRLRELDAAFIEQPVPPDDIDGLRSLRGHGLPVVADEAVFSLADVRRVIQAEAADVVSVYVGKSGALERAHQAIEALALFGIESLIGSNGEMGLGAAAQVHVACAASRLSAFPSDIIGHHYYDEDILVSPVPIDGLAAHLPPGPGLGVEPRPDIVSRFA